MNRTRIGAIIVFALGLVLLALGLLRVLPGATGGGGGLAFLGVLLFALSFIPRKVADDRAEAPLSPVERLSGIFFEPARVFRSLRAHPAWLLPFAHKNAHRNSNTSIRAVYIRYSIVVCT